jgi:glycosyltransferase involved in cell wall biosynthesis
VTEARILRLITRLNVGGPAQNALLLTRHIGPEFPTTLAAGRPAVHEGELTDPDIDVRPLPLVRPLSPTRDIRALVGARRLMDEVRPSIVHTHMAKAGAIGRIAAARSRPRPRTVHTFHGHVLESYFRPAVQRAFIEAERRLARRTDVLVAVSAGIRDSLIALGIAPRSRFHVIPVGLDLGRPLAVDGPSGRLRGALGLGQQVPLVGIIGRLVPIKDHLTAFASLESLPGVHLAVLGDGELRRDLEKAARQRGLADRIHFTGWWEDVPSALADLDAVVLTSQNEGTPVCLIEALAAGRAVVATDVGGVSSVVTDGVTGLLVAAGDSQGAASALGRLLGSPELRASFGQRGRKDVRDRFTHERMIRDTRELYEDLLRSRADRRVS